MGCYASKTQQEAQGVADARGFPVSPVTQFRERKTFSAFLSHYKMEAAMESKAPLRLKKLKAKHKLIDSSGVTIDKAYDGIALTRSRSPSPAT